MHFIYFRYYENKKMGRIEMKRLIPGILIILFIIFGLTIILVILRFPPIGDPHLPGYSGFSSPNTPPEELIKEAQSTALHYNRNAAYDTGALDIITAIIFDYRGYGKSEGVTNEQGLYADAVAAYEYLLS